MRKELTPRKRQALEMRSKIQNTALDLFNREGFENVSVEQIAQTAGCSVGNIYHYFKIEEQYLSDRNTPARDKLLDFVGQSLVSSVSEPVLYKAFIHAIKYPEQHILQKNDRRVYYRVLRELVELCQHEGSIDAARSVDEIVEDLVVLHRGTLIEWRIYEGNFDIVSRGRRMAAILLDGLNPFKAKM